MVGAHHIKPPNAPAGWFMCYQVEPQKLVDNSYIARVSTQNHSCLTGSPRYTAVVFTYGISTEKIIIRAKENIMYDLSQIALTKFDLVDVEVRFDARLVSN